jgi:hypothetical protein
MDDEETLKRFHASLLLNKHLRETYVKLQFTGGNVERVFDESPSHTETPALFTQLARFVPSPDDDSKGEWRELSR